MWHGAYQQTVSADLERQNGELLCENRQLKEEVERAMAAAERADRRLTADAHTRRIAERVQAQQLKQKKQKYEEHEKQAKKAQLEAERRSERAETRACDNSIECARLKQELLTLQAQLNERQQAEPVHAVAPPAGQQIVYTTSTEAVALEPLPAEAVPSCGDAATPVEVSAPPSTAGHMTGATALVAGEPTASPMMVDGQAAVPAFRSPPPLALTAVSSTGPAAPVEEDAASPSTSMAGFGSPTASPSSTAAATNAALPAAAVLGDGVAELADPDTTLPQEPGTSLHTRAPAGPQECAMLPLRCDDVSAFGGTDPDTGTPGPVAVIAASRPVNAGPVGPPANSGDPPAGPPADPAVSGEAGFGSPIATAAPTTVAAATEDKAAPRRPALRPIAIRLGSGGSLQPGEGFVTPSHPGALAQGNYNTPPSGEWAAQAHRRALQEAAAEAARASGGPSGSVLGVVSPRAGHPPGGTPKVLADRQVLEEGYVSSSGQEQGKLAAKSLDGVQQQPSPAGTPRGLPAQHKAAGRQPIIINLGSWSLPQPGDEWVTPGLPGALAHRNYKTPPSGDWAVFDTAASSDRAYQAQAARRVLQGADADAANVPGGANGSALGAVFPRGGGHTPQNTPDFLAMLFTNELFEPEAGAQALEEPHVSRSGQDLGRSIAMSLDGVLEQPSPAGTPVGAQGGICDVMTPEFWLPAMTPPNTMHSQGNQDMAPAQQEQGPVNVQAAGSPRAALPASARASSIPVAFGPRAASAASSAASLAATGLLAGPAAASPADAELGASLVPSSAAAARTAGPGMSLPGVAQQPSPAGTPRDDSVFRTPATGVMLGHGSMLISTHGGGHMPTGLSPGYVMTTPDFYLPVLTPVSCTPLVPASAAADRTVGREPFTDLPLFCGAQKRAASAIAAQATEDPLSPSQLHCLKKQRQIPEEDAAASQQAAAMQATLQLGKLTGPNPFAMGVHRPNNRAAAQAGKKGKSARKAAASIKSTAHASKPAHAMAPSSSSSLPLQGGGQSGAAQQAAPAAQRSAQTLSLRLETPSPDQAQKFTRAVDAAAQKHTSVARHPTDCVYRPGVMSGNAAEVHTVAVQTLRQQQAGRPLPRPGWGKPPLHPGTLNHKRRRRGTTCQADPDGSPSDEPRLKRHKPSAAGEEGGQQAPASKGHSTAGEEEAMRQVAGGEEQGEEAVVGHNTEGCEAAPAAQAAPVLPWGSMPPGAYSFSEGTAQTKARRGKRNKPYSAKLKKTGGNAAPFMQAGPECASTGCSKPCVDDSIGIQGPAHSQAPQQGSCQGQHHAALSQPAHAPDSAAVANTAHESAPLVAADSAPPVVAESAASTAAAAMSSMVTGPPSSKAADQTPRATPESNSAVAGGGAEEEAREGTSRTLIADSLSEDSEDCQAGHVQDSLASSMDVAARVEAQPSRGGSAGNPSSAAAVTSSGHACVAGGGEGQAPSDSIPASEQEGPCLFPSRRKRTRQCLDQADPDCPSSDKPGLKRHKPSAPKEEGGQQAPASEGQSTAGEEEAKRQVAGGGEEQGEGAMVGHREEEEDSEAAPAAYAAPVLPWGSMPPGAYKFIEGTVQSKAQRGKKKQTSKAKVKKRGGNATLFLLGPTPLQAAQQGQHYAALSQPASAPYSTVVDNTTHDSAPPAAADSAVPMAVDSVLSPSADSALPMAIDSPPPVSADSVPPVFADSAAPVIAGAPYSRAADLATASTAESAGGGAEEEAEEGTGHMPIVESLTETNLV
ncbi:TPA: hypothetical protein ACH3X2_006336 [Trebouxia sp. C0005]